jgi:hypothetical protein
MKTCLWPRLASFNISHWRPCSRTCSRVPVDQTFFLLRKCVRTFLSNCRVSLLLGFILLGTTWYQLRRRLIFKLLCNIRLFVSRSTCFFAFFLRGFLIRLWILILVGYRDLLIFIIYSWAGSSATLVSWFFPQGLLVLTWLVQLI